MTISSNMISTAVDDLFSIAFTEVEEILEDVLALEEALAHIQEN